MGSGVPTSVMPKGVEHIFSHLKKVEKWLVRTSVMPKGVEHVSPFDDEFMMPVCAHLSDAERR